MIRTIVLAGAVAAFATGAYACEYKKMTMAALDKNTVASTSQSTPATDRTTETAPVVAESKSAPAESAVE